MSVDNVNIQAATVRYPDSILEFILSAGCDGVSARKAEGNEKVVFLGGKPDGAFLNPELTPENRIVVTGVLKDFADARGKSPVRLKSFLTQMKEKSPRLVAIPVLLPKSEHYVCLTVARRADGKYNLVSFNPAGDAARHAKELSACENSAIEALGGADQVTLIRSKADLQSDAASCGPIVADFIGYAAANPEAFARPDFSAQNITDRLAGGDAAVSAMRHAHAILLGDDDSADLAKGTFLRHFKLPATWGMRDLRKPGNSGQGF